jgi:membrane protein implicated in regulation of membrane protease activity
MARMILVILAVAIAETAWALFSAATGVNLFLFYAVLVVASAVFWFPGLTKKRGPRKTSSGIGETNR